MSDTLIRWMIRRDLPEVLEIERQSFQFPWTEENFLSYLSQKNSAGVANCIGMVAERQELIVGFMIYELCKSQLHVLNFAVAPQDRRQGVGTQMVEKLVSKLGQQRRQDIILEVRETNLAAQLFFRGRLFLYWSTIHKHYEDTDEDAYQLIYSLDETNDDGDSVMATLGEARCDQ